MTTQPDRPAILPRRTRPQAAPDEAHDPVLPRPPVAEVSRPAIPTAPRPARRRQVAVQLSVRVPADLADQVAEEAAARGIPQRQLVEDSLRAYLGQA